MVNFSLNDYSILEKSVLFTGCFAIVFSIITFIYFLLSRHWPTHFRRTHLLHPIVVVVLSVFLIVSVLLKKPKVATPFVFGTIALFGIGIFIGLYALVKKLGVQKYIKMMHEGLLDNTDKDVPEERISTVLRYMALVFYILPAIYSAVGMTFYCYYTYSKFTND